MSVEVTTATGIGKERGPMVQEMAGRLSGHWRNQLASQMELQADETGQLNGTFRSLVGVAGGEHPVRGYFDPAMGQGGALGFVVSWRPEEHSITTWCGHYDAEHDCIVTTWLLTGGALDRNEWRSMLIGHDVFGRDQQSAE